MTLGRGIIVRPAGGQTLRILLDGPAGDGALVVVEMMLAVGSGGPPLHLHPTHTLGPPLTGAVVRSAHRV